MSLLNSIDRDHVLTAMETWDAAGGANYMLVRGGVSTHVLLHHGKEYDAAAIAGIAHGLATGRTLTVEPGSSILRAVEEAGVAVLSSCREGTCGTCETDVLDGVPDHRDSVLTEAERAAGDVMMICVSRSLTPRLVLDL